MAKKVKDSNSPDAGVTTGEKRKRKAGKDIVPRLKVIDKQSFILMASSRAKGLPTMLLWAPTPKEANRPFLFLFELPDGEGDTVLISVPMGQSQAQAVYAAHPRRVATDDMPPECPLVEVVDPPKNPKAPAAPAAPPAE